MNEPDLRGLQTGPVGVGSGPARDPGTGSGSRLAELRDRIPRCRACRDTPQGPPLAHEPRPILRLSSTARLLIASQAPGIRAHLSGVPFEDPSGERLRFWLGVDRATFHDADRIAIVPMGFCFPGHDVNKGDLPPRRECRPLWHDEIFAAMPQVETILGIGLHAIAHHANRLAPGTVLRGGLGAVVADWRRWFERPPPRMLPMPHPSWRNSAWLNRNPWFERDLLPVLRAEVGRLVRGEP